MKYEQLAQELAGLPGPWFILVVGAPGSGKSTLAGSLCNEFKIKRFSTDDKLEIMRRRGRMPDFDKIPFGALVQEMKQRIWHTTNEGKHILIDQTSMSIESRTKKLAWAGPTYTKICINLTGLTADQLEARVLFRVKQKGRHIPRRVIDEMLAKYQPPSKAEGFNYILEYNQSK